MAKKIAFTLIGHGHWSGGENYLRNMLGMISEHLSSDVESYLFLTPHQFEKIGKSMNAYLAAPPIIDRRVAGMGQGKRSLKAVVQGADKQAAELFKAHNIDIVFESAQFFGTKFPIPVLSWIPDFQHRHLSHLFPKTAWWKRDIGFRLQTNGSRLIMLSSHDALADCEKFYPKMLGRSAVVPFAIDMDPTQHYANVKPSRYTYELPDAFFYLPNQYWAHKNHRAVIEALIYIKKRGELNDLPPVYMTGRTEDPRDPALFDRDMAYAKAMSVDTHFRHLGLIPYKDVFALNAGCLALINPSRFEGWSTPVEEAKALGTPMILSGLGVHREQAPEARFFDLDNPETLADSLLSMCQNPLKRPPVSSLKSRQMSRRKAYAISFWEALQKALSPTH